MEKIEYQPILVFTVQQAGVVRFSTANFHLDISSLKIIIIIIISLGIRARCFESEDGLSIIVSVEKIIWTY